MIKVKEIVNVPLKNLVPASWRGFTTTKSKIDRARKIFSPNGEGWMGSLKGRYLSDGVTVEQATGHNRVSVMRELGIDSVPIQIVECSDDEFFGIYTRDNAKEDDQTTAWALNTVKFAPKQKGPEYDKKGLPLSKLYADLGVDMGMSDSTITHLRDMNTALDSGALVTEFSDITDISTAIYFWKRVNDLGIHRVNKRDQIMLIEMVNQKGLGDGVQSLRDAFRHWRDKLTAVPSAPKTKNNKSVESLAKSTVKYLDQLADRSEELSPEMVASLQAAVEFLVGKKSMPVSVDLPMPAEELEIIED